MNEIREIIHRLRQGEKVREVSRVLCLARNTVRKYRDLAQAHGLLDPDRPLPDTEVLGRLLGPPPLPRQMRSTVEPHAEAVEQLLDQGVEMATIWQRLQENYGYSGSYSSVRRYVSRTHPTEPEAFCRIETSPAEEAQVDFGYAGMLWDAARGCRRKVWAFVMTLSWSRHQYVEFVFNQSVETWLRCHEEAFAWFGGVPRRIVIDNVKTAVIKHDLHDPILGEPYRRLAQHYGFVISPNRPATPRHKGKVESGVGYVKRSFLAGQTFADLAAMNAHVKRWVMDVAGVRVHGTTKEMPLTRFREVERDALQPLPEASFDLLSTHRVKVHQDCHVVVNGRYYSVPYRHIGQQVDVYVGRRIVEVYSGTDLIATHAVIARRGGRETRLEHYPATKRAFMENPPDRCQERAEKIGASCAAVVRTLLSDRVQDRLRSVQSLLRLGEDVGRERLEAACQRALHFNDPSYRRIKGILNAGLDRESLLPFQVEQPLQSQYRFARPTQTFFEREVQSC